MRLRHLLWALLLLAPPAAGFAQTATPGMDGAGAVAACRAIRRLGYPFGKRADRVREVRYALLDTCPDAGVPAARPVIQVTVNGEKRLREFDVLRFFDDRREAERHAREHGAVDLETDADDYLVLPQMRPAVSFFKALETGDFALYRSAFDYDWKPRHLNSPDFWEDARRRHAERLKRLFGGGYSSAELDFRFTPLDRSETAGDIAVILRGRTFGGLMRVVFVGEAGGWKIDELRTGGD